MAQAVLSELEQVQLRHDVFAWIETRQQAKGWVSWDELRDEYFYQGMHISLIGQRGIINPSMLDETLLVQTSHRSPYLDDSSSGPLNYKFEAQHGNLGGSNIKLRRAMQNKVPIVYLEGFESGKYIAWVDVLITGEDLDAGHVTINLDKAANSVILGESGSDLEKQYSLRMAKQRVHQPKFRAEVLYAYKTSCAICRLKHGKLLDAAHIVPDSDPRGIAAVQNGMALCKIHHTAYDARFIGITPDYVVKVNADLLLEVDGPMLKHGIQEMHNTQILLPDNKNKRPDQELLAITFEKFQKSA